MSKKAKMYRAAILAAMALTIAVPTFAQVTITLPTYDAQDVVDVGVQILAWAWPLMIVGLGLLFGPAVVRAVRKALRSAVN